MADAKPGWRSILTCPAAVSQVLHVTAGRERLRYKVGMRVVRSLAVTAVVLAASVLPAAAGAQITPALSILRDANADAPRFIGSPAPRPRPVAGRTESPRHPFMAPNGRSNIHVDAYQTDANAGPLGGRMEVVSTFQVADCASVTFDSRGRIGDGGRGACAARPRRPAAPPAARRLSCGDRPAGPARTSPRVRRGAFRPLSEQKAPQSPVTQTCARRLQPSCPALARRAHGRSRVWPVVEQPGVGAPELLVTA